ncbi:MAG: T9SS type A sorting domain-containing protein, partial [Ignavibacteriales bacterium]|nr:T9SS type A sorting domain-containing protein [Ignavibacteriales bacterium]
LMSSIFIPLPSTARGVGIVLCHGLGNTRLNGLGIWCDTLAARGYLAMTIDFYDPAVGLLTVYPKPVRAFKIAVEFLRRNAARFAIRNKKVVGFGISQGALLWGQSIIWDNDDAYFRTDAAVNDRLYAAILLYGIYDNFNYLLPWEDFLLADYFSQDTLLRRTRGQCIANFQNITSPLLMMHAIGDPVCNIAQSRMLRDSLRGYGNAAQLVEFDTGAHVFDVIYGDPASKSFTALGLIAKDSVLAFLQRTLSTTSVHGETIVNLPTKYSLEQNYPNPFNSSTLIRFELPAARFVVLKVYDLLGREMAMLVNERKEVGKYSVRWNAFGVSSGIYFYVLTSEGFADIKKMLVVK